MIPATAFMLMPVIKVLEKQEAMSEKERTLSEGEVRRLVRSWGTRNTLRQMLPLSASAIALYAGLVL